MTKVLVTSVGSGVGCSIVKSLRNGGRDFTIVGLNSEAFSAGNFECDITYLVPPVLEESAFISTLINIVDKERPAMIYLGRDADLPVLSRYKKELADLGAFVMVGDPVVIDICRDKYKSYLFLLKSGLPFARTAAHPHEVRELVSQCGFPLISKPRKGNASMGVRVLFDESDLDSVMSEGSEMVFQQYLVPDVWRACNTKICRDIIEPEGNLRQEEEYSAQVLLGYNGLVLGMFVSKNTLRWGMPFTVEVVSDSGLEEEALKCAMLLSSHGLVGPCNLQAKRVDNRFVFYEINARFTGITSTRTAMGFREVEATYQYFVENQDCSAVLTFEKSQCAYRYLTESVFSTRDLVTLQANRQWRRFS